MSSISDSLNSIINGTTEGRVVSLSSEGSTVVSSGDTSAFSTDSTLGKDEFLQLLIAQLQNQDPLNPASDTEFVTQLAQFSQLEYTQNSTAAISSLAESMTQFMELQTMQAQSITNSSATQMLGKEVRVMEDSFTHTGLTERDFNIHLLDGYKDATVVIRDSSGNLIAEIEVSAESSKGGDVTVHWDGRNQQSDAQVLGGTYTIEVIDASGTKSAGYAYQDGVVTAVSFSSSGASLTVNDVKYGVGYLVDVKDPETALEDDTDTETT